MTEKQVEGLLSIVDDIVKEEILTNNKVINKKFMDQREFFVKAVVEHVDKVKEAQKEYIGHIVSSKVVTVLGIKWQTLAISLTALALFLAVFTFFDTIQKESLRAETQAFREEIFAFRSKIQTIEEMITYYKIEKMKMGSRDRKKQKSKK